MQCVSAVDPQWLVELGPMFFSVKEGDTSFLDRRRWHNEDKTAMEEKMEKLRQQAETACREKGREEKRGKSQQQVAMPGLKKGLAYLRPKRRMGL